MSLRTGFTRFLESDPDRLHFAAHSHHPWPDVSFEAHQQAWNDAAMLMDDKWDKVFGEIMPETRELIAAEIGISDPATLVFAPNTHEFLLRLFSCVEPPVRILTTDSEFHSFARQSRRWEEAGLALVDRIPTQPFESFSERFTAEARVGVHDLIFLSEVFFNSGFVVRDIDRIVSSISNEQALVVVDGYHSFMARPVQFGALQDRAFFLAGGYKYAMSGEGVCFMHCPPGYASRPVNTGWYAGFGQLESGVSDRVPFGLDGSRLSGSTFDPSGIYRMRAVLSWLRSEGFGTNRISDHVTSLQELFLDSIEDMPGDLIPPQTHERGNFLTFETPEAGEMYQRLHDRKVITDHRAGRLRIGFGVYHGPDDIAALLERMA